MSDTDWTIVDDGEWRWVIRASQTAVMQPWRENTSLRNLEPSASVIPVKVGSARTISLLQAAEGPPLYCKEFTASRRGDGWRTWLRGSQGAWEASRLYLAERRGLRAPRLVAWAERSTPAGTGESRLYLEAIEQASSLASWLPSPLYPEIIPTAAPADREAWLAPVAEMVAQMHGRGLWHGDLHAGNVLLRADNGGWQPWLIDLAALRGARIVPERHLFENLARLLTAIRRLITADEQMFFLRTYGEALRAHRPEFKESLGSTSAAALTALQTGVNRAAERILQVADRAWTRGNRKVTVTRRGHSLSEARLVVGNRLLPVDDWLVEQSSRLQGRGEVSERVPVLTPQGPRTLQLAMISPADAGRISVARMWSTGHALHRRGLPVVVPWGYLELPHAGLLAVMEPVGLIPLVALSHANHRLHDRLRERLLALVDRTTDAGFVVRTDGVCPVGITADGAWLGWIDLTALQSLSSLGIVRHDRRFNASEVVDRWLAPQAARCSPAA